MRESSSFEPSRVKIGRRVWLVVELYKTVYIKVGCVYIQTCIYKYTFCLYFTNLPGCHTWMGLYEIRHKASYLRRKQLCQILSQSGQGFRVCRGRSNFYARQVLLTARISYGNCTSICLSVTTGYRIKPRWDRDSGFTFTPYDSVQSLVSHQVIWCRWVMRWDSPRPRASKKGTLKKS